MHAGPYLYTLLPPDCLPAIALQQPSSPHGGGGGTEGGGAPDGSTSTAIKSLNAAARQAQLRALMRGARELAVMSGVSHPHIVQVRAWGLCVDRCCVLRLASMCGTPAAYCFTWFQPPSQRGLSCQDPAELQLTPFSNQCCQAQPALLSV